LVWIATGYVTRLHAASVRREVAGPWRAWRCLEVVRETGSTNSDLPAGTVAGEDIDRVVLVAEHQAAGRGRLGRAWSDAALAQIALSFAVRPGDVPIDHGAGYRLLPASRCIRMAC
jgi:BirA family transcriptional regulator, biotin operon repressor / biotin---[acetyl-CoA-carboxylase] ligase